jgi:hypothetical protein
MDDMTKPVADLSTRAVSLAREVDRLPAGEYLIHLVKPASKREPMCTDIVRAAVQVENKVTINGQGAV